ncbi:MAG TPA: PA2169 family four-helix-bundle protein [Rhizobacter sp.]|nr:PA2169 family four-helix-bundle protein [Rhizobacter sp.]
MTQTAIASTLSELLTVSKEGEYSFTIGAELLNSDELSILFMLRAGGCRRAAAELQPLIIQYRGKLQRHLDDAMASQRRWVDLRRSLSGQGDEAVLSVLERDAQDMLNRYRDALHQNLPALVKARVEKQFQVLRRSHQQINLLRDKLRASAY